MNEYHTMYHDGFSKAFFIETPNHERLAIFPYGKGQGDVSIAVAKEAAMKALDFFNGQEQHTADSEVGLDLDRAWMESRRKDKKGGQSE